MATTERSLIGKNIVITGDISATEDLVATLGRHGVG